MRPSMIHTGRLVAIGSGMILAAGLAGCGTMPTNRLLDSVHQPVVEHHAYQLDLISGPDGLAAEAEGRLADWFDALGLRYGDRIVIDDPLASPQTRVMVRRAAARFGLLIGQTAPPGPGVSAGTVRVWVLRATAGVPHCPDLATRSETNFNNATSSNYGCAINSNLAAMVANPDDLLSGAHAPTMTTTVASDKAIWLHQAAVPTGQAGVTKNATN